MGKRFEKLLDKIPTNIQQAALVELNKARIVLGGAPLKALVTAGADNSLGGTTTPLGRSIADLMTPAYSDGSGFKEITGLYTSVWEVPDAALRERLAAAWDTAYLLKKKFDYCCHRHFDEACWVVELPTALQEYERLVVDASDDASRCACGCAWYEKYRCVCGIPNADDAA